MGRRLAGVARARSPATTKLPGDPARTGREMTVLRLHCSGPLQLLMDFADSLRGTDADWSIAVDHHRIHRADVAWIDAVQSGGLATLHGARATPTAPTGRPRKYSTRCWTAIRDALDYENRPDHRRAWRLMSLVTATMRGIIVDDLITDPRGFRAINDEDFSEWVLRHGAHPDVRGIPLVRGLYDMVFGYEDGDQRSTRVRRRDSPVFLTGVVLFEYKGAIFWKMTAGMGDVVIAPLYQALRRRGVQFEFFHRLDALHLDVKPSGRRRDHHGPAGAPRRRRRTLRTTDDSSRSAGVSGRSHCSTRSNARDGIDGSGNAFRGTASDVETRVLRRGVDFDHVVLAVSHRDGRTSSPRS